MLLENPLAACISHQDRPDVSWDQDGSQPFTGTVLNLSAIKIILPDFTILLLRVPRIFRSSKRGNQFSRGSRIAWSQPARKGRMKEIFLKISQNELFYIFLNGVVIDTAFYAALMATFQVPPEALLDSGLMDILMIFEE